MSLKSDNHSHGHGTPTRRPHSSDINVDEFEVTKELFDKVMTLDKSMFNV